MLTGEAASGLVAYLLTCVAIELTPGPNMAYLAVLSAERGRLAGLYAVGGVALGLAILAVLAVLGVGEAIAAQPVLYEGLRWAGVAYLLYLAYDAWRDAQRPLGPLDAHILGWRSFRRGLINNLLNPKAALFYITVMPSFANAARPILAETAMLGAIYVAVATSIHALVVLLAGSVQPLLTGAKSRRVMGGVFAALLVGVAAWVALVTAR
ncbi:LysE family translocator [Devosia aquimaris]|uniref:LysE family translocator n=1 Tax=Devosia aquimaris TaxID=2866214 RepID=UPI001CD154AC|nr:LysE family translocator [Devosia sp. CJK-A8-3]